MPFFPESSKKVDRNKKHVTLQVRIPLVIYDFGRKRALSSASGFFKSGDKDRNRVAASLTVEAALALSLFLFAMVTLMIPMRLMNENRKVQAALESACEEISQYAYILYRTEQGENIGTSDKFNQNLAHDLTGAGAILYADQKVKAAVNTKMIGHISLLKSRFMADGETIDIIMDYKMRLPFSVFGLDSIPMTARSYRRAWIGKDGGRGQAGSGQGERDEIVYIGRSSIRYHRNRTCHYLYNDISTSTYETVQTLRNADGKKYRPCSRCGNQASPGSTVYIMPSGDSYHSSRGCSAIAAYVQAVPLSQVKHLGACSYCSQGKD